MCMVVGMTLAVCSYWGEVLVVVCESSEKVLVEGLLWML